MPQRVLPDESERRSHLLKAYSFPKWHPTDFDFVRRKIIVKSLHAEVPEVSKAVPLAARLNVHIDPVVKDEIALRMHFDFMVAWVSPKGRFLREIHRPT